MDVEVEATPSVKRTVFPTPPAYKYPHHHRNSSSPAQPAETELCDPASMFQHMSLTAEEGMRADLRRLRIGFDDVLPSTSRHTQTSTSPSTSA
ncbi:hypothetical protein A4X13_0g7247 [Tilletia indica]|uniref:Uncharacterized protein n=1 Tax=Tilletia indica TaxID=43049 RepID=A0A177T4H8_9BASI|nr:hypothetical protein A4X13_0g7247 [Tilletia indica]